MFSHLYRLKFSECPICAHSTTIPVHTVCSSMKYNPMPGRIQAQNRALDRLQMYMNDVYISFSTHSIYVLTVNSSIFVPGASCTMSCLVLILPFAIFSFSEVGVSPILFLLLLLLQNSSGFPLLPPPPVSSSSCFWRRCLLFLHATNPHSTEAGVFQQSSWSSTPISSLSSEDDV